MFAVLPLELVEQILLYLSFTDILSALSAYDIKYNILSEYFWKIVCLKEDFLRAYKTQDWYECFQSGVNKKLGYYVRINGIPSGPLEHVYLRSLITCEVKVIMNTYNVYYLDDANKFKLVQQIEGAAVKFKEEFIILPKENNVVIHMYNIDSKIYNCYRSLPECAENIFGISGKYCAVYNPNEKCFNLYTFSNNTTQKIVLPLDVKFLIGKILHNENIVITTLSFTEGYKIKVYDINSRSWTLNLVCFGSTGITNDPNVWVGSNFIGCCDVSYRLRGIYFGPFKVWNKEGKMLFQEDIEPSNKHYLRCFFKLEYVLLTTSDTTVNIYNSLGEIVSKCHISTSFLDIKLSAGRLLFVLLEEKDYVVIYDWSLCCPLYSIKLSNECSKSLYSDFLYCPLNSEGNNFEVIKFF